MRKLAVAFAFIGALGLGYACFPSATAATQPMAGYSVKIDVAEGHGSGVHIGRGYILTAAHVADKGGAEVEFDNGQRRPAQLLWSNAAYDVALLLIDEGGLEVAPLSCDEPRVGSLFRAYGSPGNIDFVSTSGSVVGGLRKFGPWQQVVVLDATIIPGMSGGALIAHGRVIGLAVGLMAAGGPTGIGYAVPGSAICKLLART